MCVLVNLGEWTILEKNPNHTCKIMASGPGILIGLPRFRLVSRWMNSKVHGKCCNYVVFILRGDTQSIIEPSGTPREERFCQLVSTARLSDSLQHAQRHSIWYMAIMPMEDVADDQQRV